MSYNEFGGYSETSYTGYPPHHQQSQDHPHGPYQTTESGSFLQGLRDSSLGGADPSYYSPYASQSYAAPLPSSSARDGYQGHSGGAGSRRQGGGRGSHHPHPYRPRGGASDRRPGDRGGNRRPPLAYQLHQGSNESSCYPNDEYTSEQQQQQSYYSNWRPGEAYPPQSVSYGHPQNGSRSGGMIGHSGMSSLSSSSNNSAALARPSKAASSMPPPISAAARPCRRLFVRNISFETQWATDLRPRFDAFGDIKSVCDLIPKRGICFLTFVSFLYFVSWT